MDIALALRSQMFATLMAAMESADPTAQARPGSVLSGRLASLPPEAAAAGAAATVHINNQPVTVALTAGAGGAETLRNLQLGALLRLRVDAVEPDGVLRATVLSASEPAVPPVAGGADAARTALQPQIAQSAARQQGLGALFANLEALVSPEARAALPPTVVRAALAALGLRYDPSKGDAAGLRTAVERSGVFHEALLAAGDAGHAAIAGTDLKSALIALRTALATTAPAADPTASAETATLSPPPRPPHRDAQPLAQPAVAATIDPAGDPSAEALAVLTRQTEGGLDRLRLLQVASLPADTKPAADPAHVQRWLVEVPMALEGRTHVLPLRIEREPDRRPDATREGPLWRVRFALDGEPLGPLAAVVTWRMRQVGVTLWAERDSTRAVLSDTASELRRALGDAARPDAPLDEIDIDIRAGAPVDPGRPAAGALLDRRS